MSPRSGRQPAHLLRCRTLRALGFLSFVILGFRSAPPQALCSHPLRGFWKRKPEYLVQTSTLVFVSLDDLGFAGAIVGKQTLGIGRQLYPAQEKFLGGIRNLDAALAKEFLDAIVDVAFDLWMAAGLASPNEQAEIERVIAEAKKLHLGWWIS